MPIPTRLWPVLLRFAIATLALLALGHPFATSAAQLAELRGLGHSFVGTVQVGLSTALPERVASITAWRIGASGLAAGNVFDSNAIDMVIFLAMDMAAPDVGTFFDLAPIHAASGLFTVILMALAAVVAVAPGTRRATMVRWLIVLGYLLALASLYAQGATWMANKQPFLPSLGWCGASAEHRCSVVGDASKPVPSSHARTVSDRAFDRGDYHALLGRKPSQQKFGHEWADLLGGEVDDADDLSTNQVGRCI